MRTTLVLAFCLAAVVTAGMAAANWRKRNEPTAYRKLIAFMGAGVAALNALSAAHVVSTSTTAVSAIISVQAVISPAVIGFVVGMSFVMCDRAWEPTRRVFTLLAIWPAVMAVAAATNPWHHLVFSEVTPIGAEGILLPD